MIKVYRIELPPLFQCDVCHAAQAPGFCITLRNLNVNICDHCYEVVGEMAHEAKAAAKG